MIERIGEWLRQAAALASHAQLFGSYYRHLWVLSTWQVPSALLQLPSGSSSPTSIVWCAPLLSLFNTDSCRGMRATVKQRPHHNLRPCRLKRELEGVPGGHAASGQGLLHSPQRLLHHTRKRGCSAALAPVSERGRLEWFKLPQSRLCRLLSCAHDSVQLNWGSVRGIERVGSLLGH